MAKSASILTPRRRAQARAEPRGVRRLISRNPAMKCREKKKAPACRPAIAARPRKEVGVIFSLPWRVILAEGACRSSPPNDARKYGAHDKKYVGVGRVRDA